MTNRGGNAPLLLVRAASGSNRSTPGLSRATYLDALSAAMFAGLLASPGGGALEVARAAGAAPRPPGAPRAPDLLLTGLAANFNEGYAAAVPILRQALTAFGANMSVDEQLHWLWLATLVALHLWDDKPWHELSDLYVQLARRAGALSELPLALSTRAIMLLFVGDLDTATSLIDEQQVVTEATGGNLAPYSGMALAALGGNEDLARSLISDTITEVGARGEGIGIAVAHWTNAVLHNGLGKYPEAMAAAQQALRAPALPGRAVPGRGELGGRRADRGGRPQRGDRHRGRGLPVDRGDDRRQPHRLGAGARGAITGADLRPETSPNRCTSRRSIGWAGPWSAPNSPGPASCTASGCAGGAAASTPANSSARRTTCSR